MFRRSRLWICSLILGVLALGIAVSASGQKGGGKPGKTTNIALMSGLRDAFNQDGSPADRIMSDCQSGELCLYVDGVDKVGSYIDSIGHYKLTANDRKENRKFWLDFSQCALPGGGCEHPFATEAENASGFVAGNDTGMASSAKAGALAPGETEPNDRLVVRFNAPDPWNGGVDTKWKIRFQPDPAPNAEDKEPCDGSSNVTISRGASGDAWTFEPSSSAPIACLESRPAGGANVPYGLRGKFYMPFKITATRK